MAKRSVEVQVDSDFALLLRESVTYEIKMEPNSKGKIRKIIFICVFFVLLSIVYFGYFCPERVCALSSPMSHLDSQTPVMRTTQLSSKDNPNRSFLSNPLVMETNPIAALTYDDVFKENFAFDMNGHDVIVFLHIQKTGGTSFGKHLVKDLDLQRPCSCQRKRKRCNCFRPNRNENWLFSRYSTGWKCGLHADWTELTSCVDTELDKNEGESIKRRYFYITLLRDPISRYLSEFRHVQRGATWRGSRHYCAGRSATSAELPPCYRGATWHGVTLDEFARCPFNLAANRQTRMLSDLALVGCYNMSYMSPEERDSIMLASAKKNLEAMAFFGLTEEQKIGQYVFEETFNLRFSVPFEQNNSTQSSMTLAQLSDDQRKMVEKLNALDIELYKFAKQLMTKRFQRLKKRDPQFEERFKRLGEITGRSEFVWNVAPSSH